MAARRDFTEIVMLPGRRSRWRRSEPLVQEQAVVRLALGADRVSRNHPGLLGTFGESTPALSPDGNWLAYQSDKTGRMEVNVRPYPGPGARVSVSLRGGTEPVWAPSGRELFFRAGDSLMVAVAASPGFAVTGPRA